MLPPALHADVVHAYAQAIDKIFLFSVPGRGGRLRAVVVPA
jgi:hypothetical protein